MARGGGGACAEDSGSAPSRAGVGSRPCLPQGPAVLPRGGAVRCGARCRRPGIGRPARVTAAPPRKGAVAGCGGGARSAGGLARDAAGERVGPWKVCLGFNSLSDRKSMSVFFRRIRKSLSPAELTGRRQWRSLLRGRSSRHESGRPGRAWPGAGSGRVFRVSGGCSRGSRAAAPVGLARWEPVLLSGRLARPAPPGAQARPAELEGGPPLRGQAPEVAVYPTVAEMKRPAGLAVKQRPLTATTAPKRTESPPERAVAVVSWANGSGPDPRQPSGS